MIIVIDSCYSLLSDNKYYEERELLAQYGQYMLKGKYLMTRFAKIKKV